MESNHRPQRYQHCALPLSYAAIVCYRESNANILLWSCSSPCVMEEEVEEPDVVIEMSPVSVMGLEGIGESEESGV